MFNDRDACMLLKYMRKNRRATVPQDNENVCAGHDQTVIKNSPTTLAERGIVGLPCVNPSLQK